MAKPTNRSHGAKILSEPTILIDLRPALEGYFGIPQQARSLFASLAETNEVRTVGLLQTASRHLVVKARDPKAPSSAEDAHSSAQMVIGLMDRGRPSPWTFIKRFLRAAAFVLRHNLFALSSRPTIRLQRFPSEHYGDFLWQNLFAKGISANRREIITKCCFFVSVVPIRVMRLAGRFIELLFGQARYPVVDTCGIDFLIAQTPYPGRVTAGTRLLINYHDAVPVVVPQTIANRAQHEFNHYSALKANIRDGAYFVCASEATRRTLIALFPETEARSRTIHNILADDFSPTRPPLICLPRIVCRHVFRPFGEGSRCLESSRAAWAAGPFSSERELIEFYERNFAPATRFLLAVSTIEPRKNHLRLIKAVTTIREAIDPELKLILVGNLGWNYDEVLAESSNLIQSGSLVLLQNLPSESLCKLYSMAAATVCPSVYEGFDFSGAEAMRCGGVVAASDIPVHREIYGRGAIYFDAYSTDSLVEVISRLLYSPDSEKIRDGVREAGILQSEKYLAGSIAPQWVDLFTTLTRA